MNAVWVNGDTLKRKELEAKSTQTFHNYVLGEPYQDLSMALLDKDVMDHRRPYLPEPLYDRGDYLKIAVGIDWGTHADHLVVMGLRENGTKDIIRLIHIPVKLTSKNINAEIEKVILEIKPYNPDIILADLGFNGNKINQLINEFGRDRVFGVKVNPHRSTGEVTPKFNMNSNEVTIDKLTNNVAMLNEMKSGAMGFYQNVDPMLEMFIQHWKNVIIRDEENDDTGELYKVIDRKGGDHFAQSSVYALVALRRIQDSLADGVGDFGYTQVSRQDVMQQNTASYGGFEGGSIYGE